MEKLKKSKGITLIALVITIIILIILAGVTISILGGQDGLIAKAKGGANDYKEKAAEEYVSLKVQEWRIKNVETGISLFSYLNEEATKGNIDIDESIQSNDANQIGVIKDNYVVIVDQNGNIEGTQKSGPRPTVDSSSIKITLADGTEIENYSQEIGTPLKIEFTTSMENGQITKVEPLTATVTTQNGVTKVEYVTNGTDKKVSFKIFATVGTQEYTLIRTISLDNKYEKPLKIIFDCNGGNPLENKKNLEEGQVIGTLPTPRKSAHRFLGWFNGTTQYTENSIMPSGDLTLTAHWAEKYLEQNLVDYWPLNGNLNNKISNRDALVIYKGTPNYEGENDSVYLNNAVLATSDNYPLTSDFTIVCQVKLEKCNTSHHGSPVLVKGNTNNNWGRYQVGCIWSLSKCFVIYSGVDDNHSAGETANSSVANQWYTIALRYDGEKMDLFKDGEKILTVEGEISDKNTPLYIGGSPTLKADVFGQSSTTGYYKNVFVYDTALTDAQIAANGWD